MSFDRDLLDLMPRTIVWEALSTLSTDGYGSQTHSTGLNVRARIQQKRTLVRDATGREVVSTATIYTPPYDADKTTIVINPYDQITLPTGFLVAGSSQPPIISVERYDDESGAFGFKVYV